MKAAGSANVGTVAGVDEIGIGVYAAATDMDAGEADVDAGGADVDAVVLLYT